MNISSFITLKELSQSSKNTNSYSADLYISPEMGIDIYIKAVDKVSLDIKNIAELSTKIAKLNSSPYSKDKDAIPELKSTLAEQYIKTRGILNEFTKGFSLTHDDSVKELMSLFYRGFDNISERFDLGYITGKPEYYTEALNRLDQTRALFLQMLELLQKEMPAETSNSSNNDV